MFAQLFKSLFLATLFITFVVNIMFLVGTKDKPPDAKVVDHETTDHRRLFMRSNAADLDFNLVDYAATANQIKEPNNTIVANKSTLSTTIPRVVVTSNNDDDNNHDYDMATLIIEAHDVTETNNPIASSSSIKGRNKVHSDYSKYYYTQVPSPTTINVAVGDHYNYQAPVLATSNPQLSNQSDNIIHYSSTQSGHKVDRARGRDLHSIKQQQQQQQESAATVQQHLSSNLSSQATTGNYLSSRQQVKQSTSNEHSSITMKLLTTSLTSASSNGGDNIKRRADTSTVEKNAKLAYSMTTTTVSSIQQRKNSPTTAANHRQLIASPKLNIKVLSSKNRVYVKVNDILIYENSANSDLTEAGGGQSIKSWQSDSVDSTAGRGIHLVVLNEFNGNVLAKRVFDTYSPHQDDELSLFVQMIRDGRILIFAIKDEATFQMPERSPARLLIRRLGSEHIMRLRWRDMWAMVTRKQTRLETNVGPGQTFAPVNRRIEIRDENNRDEIVGYEANYGESISRSAHFSEWAPAVLLESNVTLVESHSSDRRNSNVGTNNNNNNYSYEYYYNSECDWNSSQLEAEQNTFERRQDFCSKLEGYGSVCDCKNPAPITFAPKPIENSQIDKIPVIVMASNRPYYLYRMLRTLLAADGVNSSMITVFIDGYYDEPLMVTRLFNLRAVQHTPSGYRSARISQHYRASLTAIFEMFPKADHVIIIEEDLDVADDFFVYFNQTINVLDEDPSLYCISAWNDQGYDHTSKDNSLLYRVESMPGLGWLLKRKLYKEELESRWPSFERQHDWDMWIRTPDVRRGRECIVPDVSRTYHFGSKGINMNSYFQGQYFSKHAINMIPQYQFRDVNLMTKEAYEEYIVNLVRTGHVITEADMQQQLDNRVIRAPSLSSPLLQNSTTTAYNNNNSRGNFTKYLCSLADTDDDQLSSSATLHFSIGPSRGVGVSILGGQQQQQQQQQAASSRKANLSLFKIAPLPTHNEAQISNVIFIDMIDHNNFTTWLKLAKCWHIWDLDARGQHKSMWRLFLNGRHTLVIGVPASPYSKLMPSNIVPFRFI